MLSKANLHKRTGMNTCGPEGKSAHDLLVKPVNFVSSKGCINDVKQMCILLYSPSKYV